MALKVGTCRPPGRHDGSESKEGPLAASLPLGSGVGEGQDLWHRPGSHQHAPASGWGWGTAESMFLGRALASSIRSQDPPLQSQGRRQRSQPSVSMEDRPPASPAFLDKPSEPPHWSGAFSARSLLPPSGQDSLGLEAPGFGTKSLSSFPSPRPFVHTITSFISTLKMQSSLFCLFMTVFSLFEFMGRKEGSVVEGT